jgi:hypothetical protein
MKAETRIEAQLERGRSIMATEKTISRNTRINVYSTEDMNYWSSQFDASPSRIMQAVELVGPKPEDVRRYLRETQTLKRHPRRSANEFHGATARDGDRKKPRAPAKRGWKA